MKKRLLALLLVVIMVMGILPTNAFAAGQTGSSSNDNASTLAETPLTSYNITFVKDAFNITSIKVYLRDGIGGDFMQYITSTPTLNNASFTIGDGTIDMSDILTGYGLLEVDVNDTNDNEYFQSKYYFQYATWGEVVDGPPITSITYDDVVAHAEEGLYLFYKVPTNSKFTVTAVDKGDATITTYNEMVSCDITPQVAQQLLTTQGVTEPYFFDHAELRAVDSNNTIKVPFDSIKLKNGYYYVSSSISSNAEDAFDSEDWNVYFVYESAYKLTVDLRYTNGAADDAGDKINGVHYNTAQTIEYQIPRSGALELPIDVDAASNLTVTNTTGGQNTVLFSSAQDGYNIKEYLLSMAGDTIGQDQTVIVQFDGARTNNSYKLDYSHYVNSPNSYHGNEVKLFVGGTSNGTALNKNNTTTTLEQGDVLRFYCNADSATYMVNTLVLNGTALALPTWSWTGSGTHTGSADTTIYDTAGNVMAKVTTNVWIQYGSNSRISSADFYIEFNTLNSDIKLDHANLAPQTYPDLIIYEMGEGLGVQYYNSASMAVGAKKDAPIGCGIYPNENGEVYVTPEFGYYVTQFRMGTNGTMLPSTDTAATWYGYKKYSTVAGSAGSPSQTNRTNINNAGSSPGYIESDLIDFDFRYDWDGTVGGAYYTDGTTFTLGQENQATPVLNTSLQPPAPAGKNFVGWSLSPTNGNYVANYYVPGQTISRDAVSDNAASITYGTTGKATVNLYPVFQNENESPYVNYVVTIHSGGKTATFAFSGGILGASLDRDNVLALPEVAEYTGTLSQVVLDGASSDSMVKLTRAGNEFHLYYSSTQEVTVTFSSPYGFDEGTVTGSEDTATLNGVPNTTLSAGQSIPTPYTKEGYTFIGWSTDPNAVVGQELDTSTFVFPSQDITYYAIYMKNVEVTFYSWTEAGGWSDDGESGTLVLQVPYGGSLTNEQRQQIAALESQVTGYTFSGWAINGINGSTSQTNSLTGTYTVATYYYASYTPQTGIRVTLNANGGQFTSGNTVTKTGTYGEIIDYTDATPTKSGWYFAGWSTDSKAVMGDMVIRYPATSGTTYYATWIHPTLDVQVTSTHTYNGAEQTPTLSVMRNGVVLEAGSYTATYSSDRTNAGTVTVTVTTSDGSMGMTTFEIQPKQITSNTSDYTIALPDGTAAANQWYYTGSAITPNVTVTDKRIGGSGTVLEANQDFYVVYEQNTNVGSARATIIGKGNYDGNVSVNFNITTPTISLAPIADQEYTGNPIEIAESDMYVIDSQGRQLKRGTDYTVSYSQNTNVGQATVNIQGIGNYASRSITGHFNIVARSGFLTIVLDNVQLPVGDETPTVTGVWFGLTQGTDDNKLTAGSHYTLSYQMYQDGNWVTSPTGAAMSAAGQYRVVATGTGLYQGSIGRVSFVRYATGTVGGLTVDLPDIDLTYSYDGSNHNLDGAILSKLKVTETNGGATVNDYTVSVTYGSDTTDITDSLTDYKMVNAGTYVFNVSYVKAGPTTLTGTVTVYITPRDLSSAGITATYGTAVYDGSTHQSHGTTIQDAGLKNEDGTNRNTAYNLVQQSGDTGDYTMQYSHDHSTHKDVGTYTSTIQGTGNYTGTRDITFEITPKTITIPTDYNVTLKYGYTSAEAQTALQAKKQPSGAPEAMTAQEYAMSQLVSGEEIGIDLYIDDALPVGNNQQHIHGTLKDGTNKASNYVLNIQATVTVEKGSIDEPESGGSEQDSFRVILSPEKGVFTGKPHEDFEVLVIQGTSTLLSEGSDYTLTYAKKGDEENAKDSRDVINAVGDYSVIVTAIGDNYTGQRIATYTVTEANASGGDPSNPGDDTKGLAIGAINAQTYTGSAIKPALTVTFNGTEVAQSDYTAQWQNNTAVGWATVTVTYNGYKATRYFEITPKSLTSGDITAGGIAADGYPYTGGAITISDLTLSDAGLTGSNKTLQEGVDYYVTYENNVDQGNDAKVIFHGLGNYTGAKTEMFTITPANLSGDEDDATVPGTGFSVAVYPSDGVYTGQAHHPAVVVTYQGRTLVKNADYTLTYTDEENQTVGENGMISVGTYTITVTGQGNYQGKVEAFYTITEVGQGSALTVEIPYDRYTYTGSAIVPENITVTHTATGKELTTDQYTLVCSANTNVGTATVLVTGKGDYTGMAGNTTFEIIPKNLEASFVDTITDQTYTGSAIEPKPTVTDTARKVVLKEGVDYVLTYDNNVNVSNGNPTVIITGRGNYTGEVRKTFNITAANMNQGEQGGFQVNIYPESAPYTGQAQEPEVMVHYNNVLLTEGDNSNGDYYVTYAVQQGGSLESGIPKDVGTYTVTVTGRGNYQGSQTATFTITEAQQNDLRIVSPIADVTYTGSEVTPAVTVQRYTGSTWEALSQSGNYTLSYTPDDLTDTGLIMVTATGQGTYNGKEATAAFRINPATITTDWVNGVKDSVAYTGSPITQSITVTNGGKTLNPNVDYTVEYANNLNVTGSGAKATVTIRGIGNYTGTVTKEFTITAAQIGDGSGTQAGFTVSVYPAKNSYTGAAHNPAILVEHDGRRLVLNTDYTLQISGNLTGNQMIQVGEYTITVTGKGNYAGTVEATYTITQASDALTIDEIPAVTYNGKAQTPEITVTHNGEPLEKGTDYDVTYSNNTNAGLAKVEVTGKGSYGSMSGNANFQINPRSIQDGNTTDAADYITITGVDASYTYTGAAIQPTVTVKDTDISELKLNTDYTVKYGDNVSGTGTVTISGIGNYAGTVELTFTITAANMIEVSGVQDSYTYTGEPITPEVTVKDSSGLQLVKGTHYTVTYKDNLNVGTATVTVTGLGVYAGQTKVVTFEIAAKLLHLDVAVDPETAEVGGAVPNISVYLDNKELNETTDYTLTYQMYNKEGNLVDVVDDEGTGRSVTATDLTAVGMYVITAEGKGEYVGAMGSATFVRLPNSDGLTPSGGGLVEDSNVITRTYDHVDYRPVLDGIQLKGTYGEIFTEFDEITVSYNGGETTDLTTDYKIVDAGVYTVTYTVNEKGSAIVVVVINPKNINDPAIDVTGLDDDKYTYDGSEKTVDKTTVTLTDGVYGLDADTAYTVVAVTETDAGTYPVTITGTRNYTGYRFENFIINQQPITVKEMRPIEYTYGYQDSYKLNKDTDYTVTGIVPSDEENVTVDVTVPAGLNAGTHIIPAELSGDKAKNYTVDGGVEITVKPIEGGEGVGPDKDDDNDGNIEDGNGDGVIETTNGFTVTMAPTSGTFTGLAHNPAISVIYTPEDGEQVTLVQNMDYTVTYLDSTGNVVADMIQVGTYTVRIKAIGNYSGNFDLTYTITQGDGGEGGGDGDGDGDGDGNYEDGNGDHVIEVGGFRVSMTPYSGYYNSQAHNPKVTVTFTNGDNTDTLIENVDFTVAYYDSTGNTPVNAMTEIGVYTVRVTGIGNYTGNNFDLTYTILNTPSGGGGGGGGGGTTKPEPENPGDSGNNSGVTSPDKTGVSNWLITSDHIAYMSGYPGNLFGANNSMTRAEAAQLFYNLLLNKDVSITVSFKDVAADAWYAKAVKTLASLGIIKGVSADTFDPQRPITRAEFAAIAMRFTSMESTGESIFMDVSPDDWFYESVVGATQYGWIQGYPNGTFGPNNTVSRAEVTTIVNRMLGRSADENYVNNNQNTLVQFNDVVSGHWAYYQIMEATNAHDYTMSGNNETWTGLK